MEISSSEPLPAVTQLSERPRIGKGLAELFAIGIGIAVKGVFFTCPAICAKQTFLPSAKNSRWRLAAILIRTLNGLVGDDFGIFGLSV